MKLIFTSLFFPLLLSFTSLNQLPIKKNLIPYLEKGQILVFSTVNTKIVNEKKIQSLTFSASFKLNAPCQEALKKIAQYEDYKNYLGFVKESTYDIKEQLIQFLISPPFIDYPLLISFNLPRVDKAGQYPFVWKTGLFPNLQGTISAFEELNRQYTPSAIIPSCYLYLSGSWEGESQFKLGFTDFILELLVETILKEGLERLSFLSLIR